MTNVRPAKLFLIFAVTIILLSTIIIFVGNPWVSGEDKGENLTGNTCKVSNLSNTTIYNSSAYYDNDSKVCWRSVNLTLNKTRVGR